MENVEKVICCFINITQTAHELRESFLEVEKDSTQFNDRSNPREASCVICMFLLLYYKIIRANEILEFSFEYLAMKLFPAHDVAFDKGCKKICFLDSDSVVF